MAREAQGSGVHDLHHKHGVSTDEPVVRNLLTTRQAVIGKPAEAHQLFLDHVALALTVHIAQTYGGMRTNEVSQSNGLAGWQERRVKELMTATLTEELPLTRLASECGLSVRHFARAFRQTTGMPPHRWLLKHRVAHAKDLLKRRELLLAEVALEYGFADQSHFTRVFTAMVGASPGRYRKLSA